MLCSFEKGESENKKVKNAAEGFFDQYDIALLYAYIFKKIKQIFTLQSNLTVKANRY